MYVYISICRAHSHFSFETCRSLAQRSLEVHGALATRLVTKQLRRYLLAFPENVCSLRNFA